MTKVVDGWLEGVACVPSPNVDERPCGTSIDLVVIHNISLPPGEYGTSYVEDLFLNRLDTAAHPFFAELAGARVSAHLLIRRDGTAVQFASFDRRAWHAGRSRFGARARCNDFSIGIELEGSDFDQYTDAQYETLTDALAALIAAYPIHAVRGHDDVAAGRKTDPGPFFEWRRLRLPHRISLS
jgi:AmpD protein